MSQHVRVAPDRIGHLSQARGESVMNKRFFIAWIVIFIVWFGGSFVVHGLLLHDDYAKLTNLFRPEADAQQYFSLMLLAHVILALILGLVAAVIYRQPARA
jgi:hypothetical protein